MHAQARNVRIALLALVVSVFILFALFTRVSTGVTTVVTFDPPTPCVAHVQVRPFVHLAYHCD